MNWLNDFLVLNLVCDYQRVKMAGPWSCHRSEQRVVLDFFEVGYLLQFKQILLSLRAEVVPFGAVGHRAIFFGDQLRDCMLCVLRLSSRYLPSTKQTRPCSRTKQGRRGGWGAKRRGASGAE